MVEVVHRRADESVAYTAGSVGDAMSHGVISCSSETPLRVVARMMSTFGVHAIFVFDDTEAGHPWSVVSDLDVVAATPLDLDALTAGATTVTPLVEIDADRPLTEAGGLMAAHAVAHLAVTEPHTDRPIGVISTLDIATALAPGDEPR